MAFVQNALDWLRRFVESFTPYLNRFVIFFLILFIGFLVGKMLGRLLKKILSDLKADEFVRARLGLKLSIERLLAGLVAAAFYVGSVILALNSIGFTGIVFELLLLLLFFVIIASVVLAIKDTMKNLGARALRPKEFVPGAYIRMKEAEGEIKEVHLLTTVIETRAGDLLFVPNSLFQDREIKILKRKPTKKADEQ